MESALPDHPLVSVIIPAWNSEEYIDQTLRSVVDQTYRNLDIIIVDDQSTDGTPAIEEKWAARDSRIRIIKQSHQGLSAGRNRGMKEARGQFILFVDSDDLTAPQLISDCLTAREKPRDIVMYQFDTITSQGRPIESHYMHNRYSQLQVLTPVEAIKEQLAGKIGGYAWSFLAPASIYQSAHITFPIGRKIEDLARICQILGAADRIIRLPEVLYHYRLHSGSLLGSAKASTLRDWAKAISDRDAYIRSYFPELTADLVGQKIGFLGNLDYESLRQAIVFGLKLDPDSTSQRHKKHQQIKEMKAEQKTEKKSAVKTKTESEAAEGQEARHTASDGE